MADPIRTQVNLFGPTSRSETGLVKGGTTYDPNFKPLSSQLQDLFNTVLEKTGKNRNDALGAVVDNPSDPSVLFNMQEAAMVDNTARSFGSQQMKDLKDQCEGILRNA